MRELVPAGVGSLCRREKNPNSQSLTILPCLFTTSKVICQCHGNLSLRATVFGLREGQLGEMEPCDCWDWYQNAPPKEPKEFR